MYIVEKVDDIRYNVSRFTRCDLNNNGYSTYTTNVDGVYINIKQTEICTYFDLKMLLLNGASFYEIDANVYHYMNHIKYDSLIPYFI